MELREEMCILLSYSKKVSSSVSTSTSIVKLIHHRLLISRCNVQTSLHTFRVIGIL